jgi:hypothetical protein
MAKRGRPATTPKRLLLSLPPDLYELISGAAARLGTNRARLVRELIEETRPALVMLNEAIDRITGGKSEEAVSLVSAMLGKIRGEVDAADRSLGEKPLTRKRLSGRLERRLAGRK